MVRVRVRFSVRIMVRVRVRVRVVDLGSFLVLSGRKGRGQTCTVCRCISDLFD